MTETAKGPNLQRGTIASMLERNSLFFSFTVQMKLARFQDLTQQQQLVQFSLMMQA